MDLSAFKKFACIYELLLPILHPFAMRLFFSPYFLALVFPKIDQFANPAFLYLMGLIPLWGAWLWWQYRKQDWGLQFSDTKLMAHLSKTWRVRFRHSPYLLRGTALALGIVALARPQTTHTTNEKFAEGIDIMLVMDVSTSMKAMDFQPNRFVVAKQVASDFIGSRISDRVGLIVFAAEAFTQFPLTLDYDFAQQMLSEVQMDVIEDGTAIGTALATAVNRLRDSKAKSKVIILLTDGQNNHGEIDPVTASEVGQSMSVRIYTIGVGKRGSAPYPIDSPLYGTQTIQVPVEIDEDMLQTVANNTGGKYFRATNSGALEAIYQEISSLEKTKIEQRIYTDALELYHYFLWAAFAFLFLELVLRLFAFRTFP